MGFNLINFAVHLGTNKTDIKDIKEEIYHYNRVDLVENTVITSETTKNNIVYKTERNLANIFQNDTVVGQISYINHMMLNRDTPKYSFNTSIGTVITDKGTFVFKLNYKIPSDSSAPATNVIFDTVPTFVSGDYLQYKNMHININIKDMNNERIIKITYEE
jgi:hypothetical protein